MVSKAVFTNAVTDLKEQFEQRQQELMADKERAMQQLAASELKNIGYEKVLHEV